MKVKKVFNVRYERYNDSFGFIETVDKRLKATGFLDAEQIVREHIPSLIDVVSVTSLGGEEQCVT